MNRIGVLLAVMSFLSPKWSAVYGFQKDPIQETKKEVQELADAKDASMKKEIEKQQRKDQKEFDEYKKKMKQYQGKAKNMSDKVKAEAKKEMDEMQKKWSWASRN